jgi:hypothetical protein
VKNRFNAYLKKKVLLRTETAESNRSEPSAMQPHATKTLTASDTARDVQMKPVPKPTMKRKRNDDLQKGFIVSNYCHWDDDGDYECSEECGMHHALQSLHWLMS